MNVRKYLLSREDGESFIELKRMKLKTKLESKGGDASSNETRRKHGGM